MDRCKLREAGGDVGEQVAQAARAGAENDDGDSSRFKILLIGEALVDGQENVESGSFRSGEKLTIF
jgi:hypothetical protein